jgi:hypothetical protein
VSSLAGSAVEEGANGLNDFSLHICRENLGRLAMQQIILTAGRIKSAGIDGKVYMSPMIDAMLKVCVLSLVGTAIPSEMSALARLRIYDVAFNLEVTGSLPPEMGAWTDLREFKVEYTTMNGPLPSAIGNWTRLKKWYSRRIKWNGMLPTPSDMEQQAHSNSSSNSDSSKKTYNRTYIVMQYGRHSLEKKISILSTLS